MHDPRDRRRRAPGAAPAPGRTGTAAGVPGKATLVGATPGLALPAALRARLERALGADLSAVRVGEDANVAAIGARAHARGTDVLFAPGAYQPDTPDGQQLIAHEVVHLIQQAEGGVAATGEIDGTPVNSDGGLESDADQIAARALRGEQVRTSSPAPRPAEASAPIQGFFEGGAAKIANFFTPAPTNDADAHAQAARKEMAGDNQLITANDSARDARTGLLPDQEKVVHDFVVAAEKYLAAWKDQRGTANLRFAHGEAMDGLYAEFRNQLAADPSFALAWLAAQKRLSRAPNRQFVREIRMFAPDVLGDYRRMLEIEDAAESHHYELKADFAAGHSISMEGGKIGRVTRRMKVRYKNDFIDGLSWEQAIELSGFVLGISLGVGMGKSHGKGAKHGVSGEAAGDYEEAEHQPIAKYLAPDFFAGAKYTRPTGGVTGKLGPAAGGVSTGQLLITKGADKLRWDSPPAIEMSASFDESVAEEPLDPDAEAEMSVESGTSSLVGDVELHKGRWPSIVYGAELHDEEWTPLHMARIYFPTGSAALDTKDLATLEDLADEIAKRDKLPDYKGSIFKIQVSGCHSQKWDEYDDELRAYDAKPLDELTAKQRKHKEELEVMKLAENQALAYDRAANAREALVVKLGGIEARMCIGVMAAMELDDATTHEPIGDDPYTNKYEERSVLITVSYKLNSPTGRVPPPGGWPR